MSEIPQSPPPDEIQHEKLLSGEDWPMLRRDAAYTGSDGSHVRVPLEKVWEFKAGGDIQFSLALAYGLVFFSCKDKNVYAVDAATGLKRWTFKTGKAITTSPVVADGIVYVASNDRNIYAINAQSGQERWQCSTDNEVSSTPAVGHGLVFFGCKDKNVYAVDAVSGERRWVFESSYKDLSVPTIAGGKVLISGKSFASRKLYAIDAVSGTLVWERKGYLADPYPIVIGNTVLAQGKNGGLCKIDLLNGAEQGQLFSKSILATANDGIIFVTAHDPNSYGWGGLFAFKHLGKQAVTDIRPGSFYAIDLSGMIYTLDWVATRWKIFSPHLVGVTRNPPAVGGEFVFGVMLGKKELYGVNTSKFMKRLVYPLNEKIKSHPVIAGGMLFVATDKGKVHAFGGVKDSSVESVLHVTGEVAKRPKFRADLYQQQVSWPSRCCLCCGPAETRTSMSTKEGKMIFTFGNIPYCLECIKKIKKEFGGTKIFRGEEPGVKFVSSATLDFRNEKYWAMFMMANRLR